MKKILKATLLLLLASSVEVMQGQQVLLDGRGGSQAAEESAFEIVDSE